MSHFNVELIEYARANNIIILAYPPHAAHALQGLDVICFVPTKENWKKAIGEFEAQNNCAVEKEDFVEVFGNIYLKTFMPELIKKAFEKTGLIPFNPDVITEAQMKPSIPHSTRVTFPLPQPSPV